MRCAIVLKKIQAVAFLYCLVFLLRAPGQETAPAPAPTASSAQAGPAGQATGPTTAYTLPPDKFEKAKALYHLHGWLRIIGIVWGLIVLLALLYGGAVARYRDWAERLAKNSFVQAMIVVPLFLLTTSLFDLP